MDGCRVFAFLDQKCACLRGYSILSTYKQSIKLSTGFNPIIINNIYPMAEVLIDDFISGKKVVLTDESITYGETGAYFKDVIDFDYANSISNINGYEIGGLDLTIKTRRGKFRISAGVRSRIFGSKEKMLENLRKAEKLVELMMEDLLRGFIIQAIERIKRQGEMKVCKMKFTQNGIHFTPRVTYWTNNIHVYYDDAEILSPIGKFGLLASGGRSPVLVLYDSSSDKEYKYSTQLNHQPPPGELIKAQALLQYIQENNIFPTTRPARPDLSKKL